LDGKNRSSLTARRAVFNAKDGHEHLAPVFEAGVFYMGWERSDLRNLLILGWRGRKLEAVNLIPVHARGWEGEFNHL